MKRGAHLVGDDAQAVHEPRQRAVSQPDERIDRIVEREQEPAAGPQHAAKFADRDADVRFGLEVVERRSGKDGIEGVGGEGQRPHIGGHRIEAGVAGDGLGHDQRRKIDAGHRKAPCRQPADEPAARHLVEQVGLEEPRPRTAERGVARRPADQAIEQFQLLPVGELAPQGVWPTPAPVISHAVPVGLIGGQVRHRWRCLEAGDRITSVRLDHAPSK